jgi:hypothetical protein
VCEARGCNPPRSCQTSNVIISNPRPALYTRLANLGIIAVLEESIHATNTIEPNANFLFCVGVRRHLPECRGWNPLRQSGRFPQLLQEYPSRRQPLVWPMESSWMVSTIPA